MWLWFDADIFKIPLWAGWNACRLEGAFTVRRRGKWCQVGDGGFGRRDVACYVSAGGDSELEFIDGVGRDVASNISTTGYWCAVGASGVTRGGAMGCVASSSIFGSGDSSAICST